MTKRMRLRGPSLRGARKALDVKFNQFGHQLTRHRTEGEDRGTLGPAGAFAGDRDWPAETRKRESKTTTWEGGKEKKE